MANNFEPGSTTYSSRQRAVCFTLGVACTIPLTTTAALADARGGWTTHASFVPQTPNVAQPMSYAAVPAFQASHSAAANQHNESVHQAVGALFRSTVFSLPTLPVSNGADLNLASTKLSFLAGNLANFHDLTIDVGGQQKVVNLTTRLTGAELVAAQQVLTGGAQTIRLSATGAATGGVVTLDTNLMNAIDASVGGSIGSLTIARGVQVIDTMNMLNVTGGLTNYGSLVTASGAPGSSDTIAAGRINNSWGANIGSYTGGNGLFAADPILTALTSITNSGSISSAGNLTLNAPVIYNVGGSAGSPSITAQQNVNINTQALNNSGGTIAAVNGNVNIASNSALAMLGQGGTIQANNGNVNFAANNADINISGGNLLSQQVNFAAGTGVVNAGVENVTGVVNASACSVHLMADADALQVGNIDATGDPIIVNTSDVVITGNPGASGQPLTLIAGKNIISNAGSSLDSSGATGGNMYLIAGAVFTGTLPGNITVTKGSATGGIIDLTGGNGGTGAVSAIKTAGTAGAGGSINMVAYAGTNAGSGAILTPTAVKIDASGTTTSGNISLVAGAKSGTAISTGAITGGTVTVATAAPVLTSSKGIVFDGNTGAVVGTVAINGSTTANNANTTLGNVNATALNINTAGVAQVNNVATQLNLGTVNVGKTGTLAASSAAGNIVVNAPITGLNAVLSTTGAGVISTAGSGSVNTTNFTLNNGNAVSTVATNGANIIANSSGGAVVINQGTAAVNVSGKLNGAADLTVNSKGNVTVNAPTFMAGNDLTIAATGKAGIKIAAPIFLGAGTATLSTDTGLMTETVGTVLAAKDVTLTSNVSIGTKTAPFLTNASNSLSINDNGAKSIAYVTDQNINTLTLNANPTTTGGSLFFSSTANKLNVVSANYNNVSITDTLANANGIDFNTAGNLGSGTGTFTVNSASFIKNSGAAVLRGTAITLTGTAGIGTSAKRVIVDTATLTANSSQGDVYIQDLRPVTVNGSASLKGTFSLLDNATPGTNGVSITVGKAVGGGIIILDTTGGTGGSISLVGTTGTSTTSNVTLNSQTTVSTKGVINAGAITLGAAGPVTIGGNIGSPTTDITINVTGAGGVTVNGAVTGNNVAINSKLGPVTITKTIAGSGPGSSVVITGSAATPTGTAITIGGAITGETIDIGLAAGGQGNIAVNAAVGNVNTAAVKISAISGTQGSLTGVGLITGGQVDLSASNAVGSSTKLMNTAAGNLLVSSGNGPTDGAFIQQKGNVVLGNSTDNNLVLKVTGNLTVGGVVTSPSVNINTTGAISIDGTLQDTAGVGPTTGAFVIVAGTGLTVGGAGTLKSTNVTTPVSVTVKGTTTVNGDVAVDTLNLNTVGLTIGSGGKVADNADNITATGQISINGQLGNDAGTTKLNVTTTGAFLLGESDPTATVKGIGTVKAASVSNYATLTGAVNYVATGAGNAFLNFGTISGNNVSVNTSNPAGIIYNAPGAIIQAVADSPTSGNPTLNLNTYGVNNQGTISAVGQYQAGQGILNITSPGALTVTGVDGGFKAGNYNSVNLVAKGNVTVGGVTGGVNSNPFSSFNADNELGQFTVNTTGTFNSTMPGVSVLTNSTGTFGGVVSITATTIGYNGTAGTAPLFAIDVTGAGPAVSTGKAPVTLNLTGALTIGTAPGNVSVNVQGFDNTSLTKISTAGALKVNTAAFDLHYSSTSLTGLASVLITGDLNEGTKNGTNVSIKTNSTAPFLIGDATTNGMNGLLVGEGITASQLTIDAPGALTLGSKTTGAVLVAPVGIVLNNQALFVNNGSDIVADLVTLNVTGGGNTTYSNLNGDGGLSASGLTINAPNGVVTLVSGSASTTQSIFTLGADAVGTLNHITGGKFIIDAMSLSFTKNLHFDAPSPVNGGTVDINYRSPVNVVVGSKTGQISANVSATNDFDNPDGAGRFSIITPGNITADLSAVTFGRGGDLSLIATGNVLVSNVYKTSLNLWNFTSSSSEPFLFQGATKNGITDATATLLGGRIQAFNVGPVVTNGATLSGVTLDLTSLTSLDISGNGKSGFQANRSGGLVPEGGEIVFSAPRIITDQTTFTPLFADGGANGGTITINTTDKAVSIGFGKGDLYLDVGDMLNFKNVYHAGSITVASSGPNAGVLKVDLNAINFYDFYDDFVSGIGGQLTIQSAPTFALNLTNADKVLGLEHSSALFESGSSDTFFMSNATAGTGNGFVGTSVLTANKVSVDASFGTLDATGTNANTNYLSLTGNTIQFAAGQIITVQADSKALGADPANVTGNGGTIELRGNNDFAFGASGIQLVAHGDGTTANSAGGVITISQGSNNKLVFDSTTFAKLDVSNGGGLAAGLVKVATGGDVDMDAKVLVYGSKDGKLQIDGTNVLVRNAKSLNQGPNLGLAEISISSASSDDFVLGGATTNGLVDAANPTAVITATTIDLKNIIGGLTTTTGGLHVSANTLGLSAATTITFGDNDVIDAAQDPTTKGGGSISINANSLAFGPNGVSLKATGGDPAAVGGNITVAVAGNADLVVGATGLRFNVSNTTTGSAGVVNVSNGGNLTVDASNATINFGNTKDGTLTLSAAGKLLVSNLTKVGSGVGNTKISLTSASAADFKFGSATQNGITDVNPTISATEISVVNTGESGVGGIDTTGGTLTAHNLTLTTPNVVTLKAAGLTVVADTGTGDGGTITVNAGSLAGASGSKFSAKGTNGIGGNVVLTIGSTSQFVVGAGGVTVDVSTATGTTGGILTVTNGGDIKVDGSAITYGKAGGALNLAGGNILISNVNSLSTNPLAKVVLTGVSSSDFVFGGATTNGFADAGAATLTADDVSINMNTVGVQNGGIAVTGNTTVAANKLTLSTLNTVLLKAGSTLAVTADKITGDGGTLTINAGDLALTGAGSVTLTANSKSGLTAGKGGIIAVNVASTDDLTIGTGGLIFSVANIATFGGGSVIVNNGGAINADGSKIALGSAFAPSTGASLILNANGVLAVSNLTAIAALGLEVLTLTSDSNQTFSLGGSVAGTNGINDATPTFKAANINISNNGGAIDNGGSKGLTGTTSISLNASTDLGTLANPILIAGTPSAVVNSGGNAWIKTTGSTVISSGRIMGILDVQASTGDLGVGSALNVSAANVNVQYTNATVNNTNTVAIGSVEAFNGSLNVVSNAQNLLIGSQAVISAENGNIVLQNTGTAAGSNISILTGAFIHSTGALPNTSDGLIYIVTGALPSLANLAAGVSPANAKVYSGPQTGLVTFGTTTNTGGTITVAAPPTIDDPYTVLAGLARHLVFNNGSGNISVGYSVRVIADPPGMLPVFSSDSSSAASGYSAAASAAPLQMPVSSLTSVGSSVGSTAGTTPVSSISTVAAPTAIVTSQNISAPLPTLTASLPISSAAISNSGVTAASVASLLSSLSNSAATGLTSGAVAGREAGGRTLSGEVSRDVMTSGGAVIERSMDRGAQLLAPVKTTVVKTPYGTVTVAAQSVALLISTDKGLTVYNLHDGHKNAVVIDDGKAAISLMPGCSATLAHNSSGNFEEINPAKFVGYRGLMTRQHGEVKLHQAEFEIMSLIRGLPALKDLLHSDDAQTRKTIERMMKTAAILMQLSPGREPYKLFLTPELTAYAASARK